MDRISVEEYADRIAALVGVPDRGTATVELRDALDRVTADAVSTFIDLPPFRNSQMDGYAVRVADLPAAGAAVRVGTTTAAGDAGATLPAGGAVKVMTGAPLPADADAVVPVERVERIDDGSIRIRAAVHAGDYVREPGSDAAAGTVVVPRGTRLRPRHLAAIAAAGVASIVVTRRVRVAVISTGRELVEVGAALGPGQLPDANAIALAAAAAADGAEVVHVGRASDDAEAVAREVEAARTAGAQLVVTSGGISMGDFEPVRALLGEHGGTVGTVEMQPGGPQAHGSIRGLPILAFPGNPVSAQVSYALFLSPLLRGWAGLPPAARRRLALAEPVAVPPGRRRFLRARLDERGAVVPIGGTGSHLVTAMAAADVLIDLPAQLGDLPAGALVDTVEL